MRVAVLAVGAAILGSASVLLSLAPEAPANPPPASDEEPAGSPTGPPTGETHALQAHCPPCERGPLGPIGWSQVVATPAAEEPLVRAAALSLSMHEPEVVKRALAAEDPALRELAALLLNVASGRVAGCTPVTEGGHVAAVLDRLDRLLAHIRDGAEIGAADLSAAVAAAAVLNRGEGLPPACSK